MITLCVVQFSMWGHALEKVLEMSCEGSARTSVDAPLEKGLHFEITDLKFPEADSQEFEYFKYTSQIKITKDTENSLPEELKEMTLKLEEGRYSLPSEKRDVQGGAGWNGVTFYMNDMNEESRMALILSSEKDQEESTHREYKFAIVKYGADGNEEEALLAGYLFCKVKS